MFGDHYAHALRAHLRSSFSTRSTISNPRAPPPCSFADQRVEGEGLATYIRLSALQRRHLDRLALRGRI
jgi:hypothetical protein